MNPVKVNRQKLNKLTDLPNIGPACAADLRLLGIEHPQQLVGRDPYEMYHTLCHITAVQHDPCMIDVFISVARFMAGDAPRVWWDYTEERKQHLAQKKRDATP